MGHKHADQPRCEKSSWQRRPAFRLSNDLVELITLTGGGHIAVFRFLASSGLPAENTLWESPWKTIDPQRYRPQRHAREYGPPLVGRFISGYTGHSLALDYFGAPSDEEARLGFGIHGEAPSLPWRRLRQDSSRREARLRLGVRLPATALRFERELRIRPAESVVYVTECVSNERSTDHYFMWTQHVTLGPPFLAPGESQVFLPGALAKTWPHGYEGKSLLANNKEFRWPRAPGLRGQRVDLSRPFSRAGKGFVVAVLLDPHRELAFVAALNTRLSLLLGYCFRRADYPWVAIWEENLARRESPWNGRTQARGLEFGTTPLPLTKPETFLSGPLFGVPRLTRVPARGRKEISYAAFLATGPQSWRRIRDIQARPNSIIVYGPGRSERVRIPASALSALGLS